METQVRQINDNITAADLKPLNQLNNVNDVKNTINDIIGILASRGTVNGHDYGLSVDAESTYLSPKIDNKKTLIDWCLLHLGYPLITVELTEQHFDVAIADALTLYSKYASFPIKYLAVSLKPYYDRFYPKLDETTGIPKTDDNGNWVLDETKPKPKGLDLSKWNVLTVREVGAKHDRIFGMGGNEDILFGWPAFLNGTMGGMPYFGSANSMGLNWSGGFITFHNFNEFMELSRRMAGSNPDWIYDRRKKIMTLIPEPRVGQTDAILMEVECEPTVDELYGEEYFRRIVLANCKIMLGTIRSKFGSVQLIGGGNINTDIGQEGREELNNIIENIMRDTSIGQQCFIY